MAGHNGNIQERNLLGKQPARMLMFDLTLPFSCEITDDICDALENVYAVACNFNGPSRIPFFSIMALKEYAEVILPFSYVRNNFTRIQSAVAEVRSLLYNTDNINTNPTSFHHGLEEACTQFGRQLHSTLQTGGFCQHLEVIILTSQKAVMVQKLLEAVLTTLDMEHVRRVQVVSVCSEELTLEDVTLGNSQSSEVSLTRSSSSLLGSDLVETLTLEPNTLTLENFFNGWLLDTGSDSEHLHIILPATEELGEPVVLKCDLHERVINPAQLPFYNQFTVHGESSTMKTMFPSTSKAMGMTVPVYRLKVIALVPITAVCDSIVYGLPTVAQPTTCWKLDWDDLEKNQQMFRALCHTLVNKDQAVLAQMRLSDTVKNTGHRTHSLDSQPVGNFALFPSSNGSLLVKSVAVKELMLPYNTGNQQEEPTEDCQSVINDSLDQVETIESYNPLCYQSNLYNCLKNLGKKQQRPQQQKRPLETTEFMDLTNKMVSSKQSRSTKKKATVERSVEEDSCLADTPLSSRILKRGLPKVANQKRKLYTSPHEMFSLEQSVAPCGDNTVTARSGRCNRVKPMLQFPTSI